MYNLLFDFISNSLVGISSITDASQLTYATDLSVILTHVSLVLIFVVGVLFIRFLFGIVNRMF